MAKTDKILNQKKFAKDLVLEVIENIKSVKENLLIDESNLLTGQVSARNIIYVLFRKITSQDIRDKIFKFLKLFNKNKKNFSKELIIIKETNISFPNDYLIYIIKENPLIPYGLYNKNDHNKLENFIKKYLYLSFNLDIPNDLFSKEELDLYKRRIKSFDEIKIKNGYFEFSNFKSYKLFFENFIKPLDYKVSNKKINLAFDLGACYGDTAFIFHKYLKAKKVYAFEPDPDNFKILIENLRLNKLENAVIPIELGVGKENGSFYLTKAGAGSAIGTKKSNNAVKVKLTTIDNFVEENKIKKVDFIKMDIEGAEFDALKGAVKTIKRDKPDLLIAIYHKGEHFFEIPGWLKKLVPQYNLRFIAMNGASPVIERYIGASV